MSLINYVLYDGGKVINQFVVLLMNQLILYENVC